jgi:hypothetical protein
MTLPWSNAALATASDLPTSDAPPTRAEIIEAHRTSAKGLFGLALNSGGFGFIFLAKILQHIGSTDGQIVVDKYAVALATLIGVAGLVCLVINIVWSWKLFLSQRWADAEKLCYPNPQKVSVVQLRFVSGLLAVTALLAVAAVGFFLTLGGTISKTTFDLTFLAISILSAGILLTIAFSRLNRGLAIALGEVDLDPTAGA